MSRAQTILLHLANLAVAGTGLVYAWMRYLLQPADEWAVVNHPWQPHLQHLHVLAAALLVFAVGLIWSAHVVGKLHNGHKNRIVGVGLTLLFAPMAASGYLVQVAVTPGWRETWIGVHVVSSLLWVIAFSVHQLVALVTKRNRVAMEADQTFLRIVNKQPVTSARPPTQNPPERPVTSPNHPPSDQSSFG